MGIDKQRDPYLRPHSEDLYLSSSKDIKNSDKKYTPSRYRETPMNDAGIGAALRLGEYQGQQSFTIAVKVPDCQPPLSTDELRQAAATVSEADRAKIETSLGGILGSVGLGQPGRVVFVADVTADSKVVADTGGNFFAEDAFYRKTIVPQGRHALVEAPNSLVEAYRDALQAIADSRQSTD